MLLLNPLSAIGDAQVFPPAFLFQKSDDFRACLRRNAHHLLDFLICPGAFLAGNFQFTVFGDNAFMLLAADIFYFTPTPALD
jgi:hypothetical protein